VLSGFRPFLFGFASEKKTEIGEKAHIYLLDEALNIESFGKVSSNLATMIADCASACSFRELAKKISNIASSEA